MPRITGITRSSLWNAWRIIRKQLTRASVRDVTDFVEYDIDPDSWITKLLDAIKRGRYEPGTVHRFTIAKKMGFSRQMAQPDIPDLVLFRAAVDLIYKKVKPREKRHVYFAQNRLSKKLNSIQRAIDLGDGEYKFTSGSAFITWLEYDQYRKRLLLDEVYPYIVISDITNYFDTILYDRVLDVLHGIRVDRNLVGLVFFLLEKFSYRDAFNESPRIGLPVDEFDCSRTLAHIVLFPHDDRMVERVGESAYVRWMDDQNFGVHGYAEGLKVLKACGQSLRRLHLTPNASKSRILSLKQASRHFHFDINARLDRVETMPRKTKAELREFRKALNEAWQHAKKLESHGGEWGKVLKRFYRLAGIGRARFLRKRAKRDILEEPTFADRIANYMRVVSTPSEYIEFVMALLENEEQVYPDVNQILIEEFLRLEAVGNDAKSIRKIASELLRGKQRFCGSDRCAVIAPLLILRFGDARSVPTLKSIVDRLNNVAHPAIGKAVVAVYVSYGNRQYKHAIRAASKLRDNYLAYFFAMIDTAIHYNEIPERFKIRRQPVFDSVAGIKRLDMRKLLTLRLLKLNKKKVVADWVSSSVTWICEQDISDYDKNLCKRLLR